MMMKQLTAILLSMIVLVSPAFAVEPSEILDDPVLESRARELSAGLRCLVCQNQSIDDSNAGLAKDLRLLVRERLVAGDTNDQAVNYIVSKYGEYVLLKPKIAMHTIFLWFGPFVLLAIGIFALFRMKSRPVLTTRENVLTDEEKKQLKDLV